MLKLKILASSIVLLGGGLSLAPSLPVIQASGQGPAPKRPSKLVTAKLICVTPMADGLDQWILDALRAWGKYKVTGDPEGADLVMRAYKPEKEPQYGVGRRGIPQPKGERHELPVLSITVVDWVTNESLWQAELIDKKWREEGAQSPAGPKIQLNARGLKPDQLGAKLAQKLRQYVGELEKAAGQNQKPEARNERRATRGCNSKPSGHAFRRAARVSPSSGFSG